MRVTGSPLVITELSPISYLLRLSHGTARHAFMEWKWKKRNELTGRDDEDSGLS
jgi:hypothetical protein